ncbi:hypothetical protein Tco_0543667 [Tanacetum coccineum]
MKNNSVCKENGSNVFRKEREQYHEIQDLKAQMQDKNIAISELKKLIKKCKGKSVETQFDKPSVVRQPNAQRILKPSVLGKPTPFSNSPEMRSFQTKQSVNKTNVSNTKPTCLHLQSHHSTSASRPPLKSYQVKDKVVPNNSQVKFTKKEVEDHHRISSISKKTKSVTVCNNTTNSRTSNVNAVCAECGKCVLNSNHDACVSRYLNVVNARTKKPNVVPIGDSKPKRKANKSVATTHKKTVASDTTIQKPKSYFKELYENTNQTWKWWIQKKCPSEYKWTQTTPPRPSLKWKPTGRIFSNVHFRWIPTGKLFNSCTGKNGFTKDELHQWRLLKITLRAPFLNVQMTFVHISSGLVLHQMTSAHNRFENSGIRVHNNEPSSSKLVTKVVLLAVKTTTSRQELELLFHHHIAMLRTTGINPMIQPEPEDLPKDNLKLEIAVLRSMFEISGNNFNDWFRQLKMVLRVERKLFVIKQPISLASPTDSEYLRSGMRYMIHNEELKSMFEKQAGVEWFDLIQTFHACKQDEGKPVGPYVIR